MNARKRKFGWKTIAIVIITTMIGTILFAFIFPWLALLSAVSFVVGGITFAAWPAMAERPSPESLPSRPRKQRIFIGTLFVLYGVVLLALSQSQIRANWRWDNTRAEVARELENAKNALENECVDDALKICNFIETTATTNEKTQLDAIRSRASSIQKAIDAKNANAQVRRLVSEGKNHLLQRDVQSAQAALDSALSVPMATDFSCTTELANGIVAARTELASDFLDASDFDNARKQAQQAISTRSATDTGQAKLLVTEVANREVEALTSSAREALANMERNQAAIYVEKAMAIPNATITAEAEIMLAGIRKSRESEANARVTNLMQDARRSIDEKNWDDAIKTLNAAMVVPNSTRKADVTAMLSDVQEQRTAEKHRAAAAEAARKAKEEYEQNGLVLLRQTVKGTAGQFGGEITGIVINRRNQKLSYAQITFNLYDKNGDQVGTALDNINGLEPGGRWKFRATSLGTDFSSYKINELTGF